MMKIGELRTGWKGDAASDNTKRIRARVLYPVLGKCERCPSPATDRHHKDSNTGNNVRSNLAFLCRRCHMAEDGRLDALRSLPRPVKLPKVCAVCGRPAKLSRLSKCERCYDHFRRNGTEWTPEYQPRHRASPRRYCDNCGEYAPPRKWTKGRCAPCRQYFANYKIERPARLWANVRAKEKP